MKASCVRKGDVVEIKKRPGRVIDTSYSGCFCRGGRSHFVAIDLFTGNRMEDMVRSAPTQVRVELEEKELLNLDSDGFCSVMGANGAVEENMEVASLKGLENQIRHLWKDGERNLEVEILEALGERKIVGAWEVREMKLLGVDGEESVLVEGEEDDMCVVYNVPFPAVKEEIERMIEEVNSGKDVLVKVRAKMGGSCLVQNWQLVL